MISQETALRIARAHREIEVAENLLKKVQDVLKDGDVSDVRDHFGRARRSLELGIPSGESSFRLVDVSYEVAEPIILAHITAKRADIAAFSRIAVTEVAEGDA